MGDSADVSATIVTKSSNPDSLAPLGKKIALFKEYMVHFRYLAAHTLLTEIEKDLEGTNHSGDEIDAAKQELATLVEVIGIVKDRTPKLMKAYESFESDEGWTLVQEYFGVKTYSRYDEDTTHAMWIKMVGHLEDTSLLDCLAVWREGEHYDAWMPLCSDSKELGKLTDVEFISWAKFSVPFFTRDLVMHGYGADLSEEKGCVVLLAGSVDSHPKVEVPPPEGWCVRVDIQAQILIEPVSRMSIRNVIIARTDLKAPIPDMIQQVIVKRIACVLLTRMQGAAAAVRTAPTKSPHAASIKKDSAFYEDFLRPRVDRIMELKGW